MRQIDRGVAWALASGCSLSIGLFRTVVGLMAMRHLALFARDWSISGFYADTFHLPYAAWIPQPGAGVYASILALGIVSGGFLAIGCCTRAAALTCFLTVTYHLSLNEVWYRHNRYFLVLLLLLVWLSPCETALTRETLSSGRAPRGPRWTRLLIQVQMTLIYLASATSKSLDAAWRGGYVLEGRSVGDIWSSMMPGFIVKLIPPDAGVRLLTAKALVMEFSIGTLLWFPRTRRLAIWIGIIFHGFIELQFDVLTYSYLTLATYFVFADPEPGRKTLVLPETGRVTRLVEVVLPLLDWMFQVRLAKHARAETVFVGSDGTAHRGLAAWIQLGANLPLTYPPCYPLSWIAGRGRGDPPDDTRPVESGRAPWAALAVWLAGYLMFSAAANVHPILRLAHDTLRFADLPWFFALMCLIAAVHHRQLVKSD